MPSKRCQICGNYRRMDELSVCCKKCEEKELDLLMAVYAFIHLMGSDYRPGNEIIDNVEPVRSIEVNITFLRSWVARNWLEKNELEALRVPPPIKKVLEEGGFHVTKQMVHTLDELKNKKPKYDPTILKKDDKKPEAKHYRTGMVYLEKKQKE